MDFECTIESIDETTYYGDTTNFDIKDQDKWELMEQKPKQKFKIGDWVVGANNVCKIIALNDELNCYIAVTINNEEIKIPYYFDDAQGHMCSYHLWSIEDAKDGDVLVCDVYEKPFLFKGLLDPNHPNCPVAYCGIDPVENFCVSARNYWWTYDNVKPATKEQRNLLYQKMHEAGYEWDANKKEFN